MTEKRYSWLCTAYKMHSEMLCERKHSHVMWLYIILAQLNWRRVHQVWVQQNYKCFFAVFFLCFLFFWKLFFWKHCFFLCGAFCVCCLFISLFFCTSAVQWRNTISGYIQIYSRNVVTTRGKKIVKMCFWYYLLV